MLDKIDLGQKLGKEEYRHQRSILRSRLLRLQRACWRNQVPVIVVFEGWKGTGKGGMINGLTQPLEPRGFHFHAMQARRSYERLMPWLWRFWLRIPNYGEIAIFDRSWYRRVLVDRIEGRVSEEEWREAYRDIIDFERTLAEDGYKILKFFLHTSKKEQKKRFRKLETDPLESWRVQPGDWRQNKRYDEYVVVVEEMLELTESEWASWTIIEAPDKRYARIKVLRTVAEALNTALEERGIEMPDDQFEDDYLRLAEETDELTGADADDNDDAGEAEQA